jgi:hypothetical protein
MKIASREELFAGLRRFELQPVEAISA